MSVIFRYQPFVAVFGNLGGKVPVVDDVSSSQERVVYPTTSLNGNCIEFAFQIDGKFNIDLIQTYLAVKLKFVNGRCYETYNTKAGKKEHKGEEAKADEETMAEEEEQEAPVPLVTLVNNILHSVFSNVVVFINSQQIYISNGLYAHKFYLSNTFSGSSMKMWDFCSARVTTMKNFVMKL